MRHVTYSTWSPLYKSIVEMRDRAQALLDAVDGMEAAISHDDPTPEANRRALDAYEQAPTLLLNFERAVHPRNVATLRRRLMRVRGVKWDKWARAAARRRT